MLPVDLVVNCYERTYRAVLTPGFFDAVEQQNRVRVAGKWALVNNVTDPDDARRRAEALTEISGFTFVDPLRERARQEVRLPRRVLRRRPYLLDYGLVMGHVGSAPYVLGWDAEVRLSEPADWLTEAVGLLDRRPDVFSAAPRWPARTHDTLPDESFTQDGPWSLNWGFSDQVFLVRRVEITSAIYQRFAPASWARNAEHPWTFESRVEAYQRASRRPRASHRGVRYEHNDLPELPIREGGRRGREALEYAVLSRAARILHRWPSGNPRWRI